MKRPFKLYWVETPAPEENCFVAARSKRGAAKHEEDGTGFDPNDCSAELIQQLDPEWVNRYYGDGKPPISDVNAFYVQPEDVGQLGINWTVVEGDDVFYYDGRRYLRQGALNYVASLGKKPKNRIIRSVADLLEIIQRDAPGDWIFRGHGSCRWELKASVHRLTERSGCGSDELVGFERKLLSEFKRRAQIFLQTRPASDWEWMVLAQHSVYRPGFWIGPRTRS